MRRILIPLLAACAAAGLAGTLYLVFYVTKLEQNLFFNQKIFYWHVPNWFMLFSMVFLCGGASIGYLVKRDPKWDDVAHAAGELAVLFGAIGLDSGVETYHSMELVRLAFPRRMYTQSHFDYAAEVIAEVKQKAASIRGVKITKQPQFLRHFTCECEWV